MISKILVALDESENSRKALTFSAELASKVSSELLILTVIPPVSPSLLYRGGGRGLGGGGGGGVARAQVVSDRIDDVESSMEDKHQKILSDSYELVEGRYP
jgi:nucleotide-binding universal stress UspA family protein